MLISLKTISIIINIISNIILEINYLAKISLNSSTYHPAMQFSVKKRNGPARIAELTVNRKKIITPKILFVNTQRFKAPEFADFLLTNDNKKTEKPSLEFSGKLGLQRIIEKRDGNCCLVSANEEIDPTVKDYSATIFILTNALQLFNQPRKFVDFTIDLREKIGYQKAIYLPAIGDPTTFALLTYLGIDLFDSTSAIIAARNNYLLFETGKFKIDELNELPCSCPSCNKIRKKPSEFKFQEILNHNYYTINSEIKHVRNAIVKEDLRNLVENRIRTDPNLAAVLRNLDRNHYEFLEKRTAISSKGKLIATSNESLYRPEIKRFQERVINRYKKPDSAKALLLLPCSAKKPYSFSKSHKLFREKLLSTKNPHVVHELIVTSPLGLVPRELELVCPASSYDISVTGIWDETEKKIITELLSKYLKLNKYKKIIAHLPEEIMDFIGCILEKPVITCTNNPTSRESLDNLYETLNATVNNFEKINTKNRATQDVEAFATYQFGKKIAEKLLKDCVIKGKYPYQKIIYKNKQIGMIIKERGLISLTLDGARRIANSGQYWVEIYDDFQLKGSVFVPGVKDADETIRVGDEVIVIKNNKLFAVGVAQMNGDEMKKSSQGEAVKVRHRI